GVQISTHGREDRFEDPGIEEEGRPQVKTEAVLTDCRGPAADPRLTLQHGHIVTRPGQQHRAGQAAGSRTDDDDSFRSGHDGGSNSDNHLFTIKGGSAVGRSRRKRARSNRWKPLMWPQDQFIARSWL